MGLVDELFVRLGLKGEREFEAKLRKATQSAEKDLGRVRSAAKRATEAFSGLKGIVAGLAVGAFLKQAVGEFAAAEEASVKLRAAIEKQGESWGRWGAELDEFAKKRQLATIFGDDETKAAMQVMISKGMQVRDVTRAIAAAQDISAATGVDLATVSDAITRASSGMTRALYMLVPQIRELDSEGLSLSQTLALVEKNMGGMAEAAAESTMGRLKQLENAWGDLLEAMGGVLANPVVLEWIQTLVKELQLLTQILENRFGSGKGDARGSEEMAKAADRLVKAQLELNRFEQMRDKVPARWMNAWKIRHAQLETEIAAAKDLFLIEQRTFQQREEARKRVRESASRRVGGSAGGETAGGGTRRKVEPIQEFVGETGRTSEGFGNIRKVVQENNEAAQQFESAWIGALQDIDSILEQVEYHFTDFFDSILQGGAKGRKAFEQLGRDILATIRRVIASRLASLFMNLITAGGFALLQRAGLMVAGSSDLMGGTGQAPIGGGPSTMSLPGRRGGAGVSIDNRIVLDGQEVYRWQKRRGLEMERGHIGGSA